MAASLEPVAARLDQVDPHWAWQPYGPSAEAPWNLPRAAHLYRRAAFGANWSQLQRALAAGCPETVDRLVNGSGNQEGADRDSFYRDARSMVESLRGSNNREDLPAWWLFVMLQTPHPLLEKMTLFWHGHFATSAAKVTDSRLMYEQNELLRKYALGNFTPLLSQMARDPAMLIWLDSVTNRKSQPNENFAREVMELFALGLGHYTEDDIKAAARAFTGWEVRYGAFRINRYQHDTSPKHVLGQRGAWDGEDVIRIILQQSAAAQFLCGKIVRYLVTEEELPPKLLEPLAAGYRERDYDAAWLVRTILSSNLFYSPYAIGQKIKSPVDYAVGLVRALQGTANTYALTTDLAKLGQAVFAPPNVKGWNGGTDWINASTLLARANLAWALVGGADDRYNGGIQLTKLPALADVKTPAQTARRLVDLLLASPVPDENMVQLTHLAGSSDRSESLARLVQAITTLPEFQLA